MSIDCGVIAARLSKALSSRNISPVANSDFNQAILDYFSDNDLDLVTKLLDKPDFKPDWHYIEVGEGSSSMNAMDQINISESRSAALSTVLIEIDDLHEYPDAIMVNGDTIEFMSSGKLMYRIGKVEYSEVDPALSARCASHLKGIYRFGDSTRLVRRLQSLPGLQDLTNEDVLRDDDKHGGAMLSSVDNFPVFLRAMLLERFKIDIQQSAALEICAEMFGFKSWHVLKAASTSYDVTNKPMVLDIRVGDRKGFTFYHSNSDAIIGFAHAVKNFPGSESLILRFMGAGFFYDGVFMGAYEPEKVASTYLNEPFYEDILSIYSPSLKGFHEDANALSEWVPISDIQTIAATLRKILKVDSSFTDQVSASNRRQNETTITIKDYLFTMIFDRTKPLLKVQKLTDDGRALTNFRALYAETYKAGLGFESQGLVLKADYGNEVVATFEDFSQDEAEQISKFSGIMLDSVVPRLIR